MDGALLRSAFRSPRPTVAVLLFILALAVIPPFIFLVYSSFHTFNPDGSFGPATFANFVQLFTDPKFFRSLMRSVAYALGASLLAIVIGALQAWLAERTDAPMRQFLYVSAIVSLGIPYVLYIVAWLLFLGKSGPINQALSAMFGAGHYVDVNSLGGMIFVEGMMWSPLAFLLLSSVFRNADASYEEAATMCGAGLLSQLRHITLGMARPALLALAILVFIRASESFEVPALVGLPGSVQVLTTDIYQRLHLDVPPNVGSAAAFGCFILVLMVVLLHLYSRVSAEAHRYRTVTGKGFRPRIMRLGPWRPFAGALVVGVPFIVILVPLLTVFWAALLPYYQSFSIAALKRVTLANFTQALNSSSFHDTILNSLVLAGVTATIVTALAAIMGWCVARESLRRTTDRHDGLGAAGVSGDRARLCVLGNLPEPSAGLLRNAAFADHRLLGRIPALWAALHPARRHPDPSRAGRGREHGRRGPSEHLRQDHPAAAGPCPGLVLAVRVPAGGARDVAGATAVGAGSARHGRDAVRSLEQRPDQRVRGARLPVDADHDVLQHHLLFRRKALPTGCRLAAREKGNDVLSVENLSKSYTLSDRTQVGGVRDVSFDVAQGEFYTLLGPSGCGKTTTLRCVAGLEEPSAGRIALHGADVFDANKRTNVPPNKRNIGMVFQSYAVWPHMTVFDNTAFPLRMSRTRRYSEPEIATRTHKTLETMGLGTYAIRSASQLSGGQQQRLSLARALVAEPRLLLLDEPLSNLDAVLRDQMRVELRRLQKDVGIAAIYVTHDQSEALALSDRIAIMRDGQIVQIGTPTEIYHAPASTFVATFVGRSNLLDGKIRAVSAASKTTVIDTALGPVECHAHLKTSAQQAGVAMVRPEYVALERDRRPNAALPANHFRGKIVAAAFLGELTEYRIAMDHGIEITARKALSDEIGNGDTVVVSFPQSHTLALPKQASE